MVHPRPSALALLLFGSAAMGCAGGGPLLHPAHVLRPGFVSVGAGVSGQMALMGRAAPAAPGSGAPEAGVNQADLEQLTVAPGIAPWVGGRMGLDGSNEAGLTYSGRTIRVDGRHAFDLGAPTLSIGLGASAVFARRPGEGADGSSVYGGGLDMPVLLGFRSQSDLYALWLGPRVGFELLRGRLRRPSVDPAEEDALVDLSGQHLRLGFVLGAQAGFRHVHAAVEVGAAYHRAEGELGGAEVFFEQATITPGGGLILTF